MSALAAKRGRVPSSEPSRACPSQCSSLSKVQSRSGNCHPPCIRDVVQENVGFPHRLWMSRLSIVIFFFVNLLVSPRNAFSACRLDLFTRSRFPAVPCPSSPDNSVFLLARFIFYVAQLRVSCRLSSYHPSCFSSAM